MIAYERTRHENKKNHRYKEQSWLKHKKHHKTLMKRIFRVMMKTYTPTHDHFVQLLPKGKNVKVM